MKDIQIGLIGGNGWLGRSLLEAFLGAGLLHPAQIRVSSRHNWKERPAGFEDIIHLTDNQTLVDKSDIVIISVRPEDFEQVKVNASGRLVISVMAGIATEQLIEATQASQIIRAMPNAAASIRQSYTPWFASSAVSEKQKQYIQQLFTSCGSCDELTEEHQLNLFTALTGSGPAFPALMAQALMNYAISQNISKSVAQRAAISVVAGASQLLEQADTDITAVVDSFIDYDGTTAAGLRRMIDGGFAQLVASAMREAETKAANLIIP